MTVKGDTTITLKGENTITISDTGGSPLWRNGHYRGLTIQEKRQFKADVCS